MLTETSESIPARTGIREGYRYFVCVSVSLVLQYTDAVLPAYIHADAGRLQELMDTTEHTLVVLLSVKTVSHFLAYIQMLVVCYLIETVRHTKTALLSAKTVSLIYWHTDRCWLSSGLDGYHWIHPSGTTFCENSLTFPGIHTDAGSLRDLMETIGHTLKWFYASCENSGTFHLLACEYKLVLFKA